MQRFASSQIGSSINQGRPSRQPRYVRWFICLCFAAVVTLVALQYSFRHGRLITMPIYDDIGYFADAAQRVEVFYDGGLSGLRWMYDQNAPHSPYSTTMAMAGFLLFGFHDWAPHVMNSLLALGYFLAADRWLRGARVWAKLICFAIVAMLPFVAMAVQEFRPDHAVALFTSIGVFLLVSEPFVYGPRKRQLAAGAWLGLAMLTKPPVFPQTMVLGCAAMGLATLSDWIVTRKFPRIVAVVRAWVMVLIPFILIPLPHYLHDRNHIFSYIHDILFGHFEKSYSYEGSRAEHLLYYLTGHGGQLMLGEFLWLLAAVIALGAVVFVIRKKWRDVVRLGAMIGVIGLAWLIPTTLKTKQEFFGLTFDTLLAFTALFVAGRWLVAGQMNVRSKIPWSLAGAFFSLLVAIYIFQWPWRSGNVNAGWVHQRRLITEEIFNTIISHSNFHHDDLAPLPEPSIPDAKKITTGRPTIVFCGIGDFNPDLVHYWAARGQFPVQTLFRAASTDMNEMLSDFPDADFLFCAEPDTQLIADHLPCAALLQPLLDNAKSRSEFVLAGKWTFMKSTHSLYLFQRIDFSGYEVISGMDPIEGPYPQFKYGFVQWGIGPSTKLRVPVDRDGVYEVYWDATTGFQNEVVTIKLDGQAIGTQTVRYSRKSQFGENRFPITMKAGTHELEFAYPFWDTNDPRHTAVLFHHLNIARKE